MATDLPFIDEFDTMVEAPAGQVFLSTAKTIGGSFEGPGARLFARLLGCVPRGTSYGVPPIEGQEANGFRVMKVVEPLELVLEGQHRFATYRLSFLVEELGPGRARLRARTDAVFPGFKGAMYRALVIGSGGHTFVVKRMLAVIGRHAARA